MKQLIALTSTLLLVSLAGAAMAETGNSGSHRQKHSDRRAERHTRADENQDGVVTLREAQDSAWRRLAQKDKNQDGILTTEELNEAEAHRAPTPNDDDFTAHFAKLDKNGDGGLDLSELRSTKVTLERFDENKDQKLSLAEWMKLQKALLHRTDARKQARCLERFSKTDLNADGKLTRSEVEASVSARFALLDENKDGVLTAQEMASSPKASQKAHAKKPKSTRTK